jgi:hypothetical protein
MKSLTNKMLAVLCAVTSSFSFAMDINQTIVDNLSKNNTEAVLKDISQINVKAINSGTVYGDKTFLEHVLDSKIESQQRVQVLKAVFEQRRSDSWFSWFKTRVNPNTETKLSIPRDPLLVRAKTLGEVEVLVKNGSDVNARTRIGHLVLGHVKTKFDSTQSKELSDIAQYLKYKGAYEKASGLIGFIKTNRCYSKYPVLIALGAIGAFFATGGLIMLDDILTIRSMRNIK